MRILKTSFAAALLAGAAFTAPAHAQVAGLGTADELTVIMSSNAFKNGFQKISTDQGDNLTLIDKRGQEVQDLQQQLAKKFDANKDGNLAADEQEKAQNSKDPLLDQIAQKQQEMEQLEAPVRLAQIFVVDALDKNYQQAVKDVATAKKVSVILSPDAIVWTANPELLNLNKAITTRLDQLMPTVNTTPPDPFNTSRRVMAVYQQIQEVQQQRLMAAIRQAQAQQAQQDQQAQPGAAQPAPAPAAGPKPAPKPGSDPNSDTGTGG
jgi:Skp family chaperone for outer membrane proteins